MSEWRAPSAKECHGEEPQMCSHQSTSCFFHMPSHWLQKMVRWSSWITVWPL